MFDPSVFAQTRLDRLESDADGYARTELAGLSAEAGLDEETRRLQILQSFRLVDTEPEPAFDDIVTLASMICGTPIALVSLVTDDRQWFKARVGMEPNETPRDQSFCAHAIRNPSRIMEVPDASQDARFMHNPLVVGAPGIRFYAGAPLLSPSGAALGTVCVIDRVARALTPAMEQGLQALARQAGELLALRRANSDLESLNQSVMEMQVELEQYQVQLENENATLAEASPVDPVSGLNNQRTFEQQLEDELNRVERLKTPMALMLADIDHLRLYASDFGGAAGNDALRRVAKVMKSQARGYDTLACLRSRRFAVLLPGADKVLLTAVAERFRHAVAALPPIGRVLTVSIGATTAQQIDAPLDVMERARTELSRASALGGNQVAITEA